MLAQAMFVHGVDRRIAYGALALPGVGSSAFRILLVYGAVCTAISMWISNTATTAMMFPIGLSILAHLSRTSPDKEKVRRYALAMMLITSFGPSIGGMGTPVGTPPNLIGIGMLEKIVGQQIGRASCRERVERPRAGGKVKKTRASSSGRWPVLRGR